MTLRFCNSLVVTALVVGGSVAVGCGSSDSKRTNPADAGAAGADNEQAAGAGQGGTAAGAAAGGGTNQSGAPGLGGVGATGAATEGGAAGEAPVTECSVSGSVAGLELDPEPVYQGCRGAVVKVPFDVQSAADTFECCGVSTSAPQFTLSLLGAYNHDGGGQLAFQVPSNAPYGSYALGLICQTQPNDQRIALEIGDSAAPVVDSISAAVTPTSKMLIKGRELAGVTYVGGIRADGRSFECVFKPADKTSTSISCDFGNAVTLSKDGNDYYFIDVYADDCGHAASPPPFLVVDQLPD